MKRFLLVSTILASCFSSFSQQKEKTVFKNAVDSFSYALGQTFAAYYKTQGVKNYNTDLFLQAIKDVLNNKHEFTEEQANKILGAFVSKARIDRITANKAESDQFLKENGKKQGVITTASGLQYLILKQGDGTIPTALDTVKVNYRGSLIDGTVFDQSEDHGGAVRFPVRGMVQGWTEALQLMPKGSKWRLFIPSELAYGENGAGDKIAPNMVLIYEIEVLDVMKFIPPKID